MFRHRIGCEIVNSTVMPLLIIELDLRRTFGRLEAMKMLSFKQLRCSFCRKTDSQVEKLVAGPRALTGARVYICDACVAIATEIMNQPPSDPNAASIHLSMWRKLSHGVRRLIRGGRAQSIGLPAAS
jgi:hypothetical protein